MASEETTFSEQMFHTTFETFLVVELASCKDTAEVVTCRLTYTAVNGVESIQRDTSICGESVVIHVHVHHTLLKCNKTHVQLHHCFPV